MINADCTIQEVRDLFTHDRFATEACGCRVVDAHKGYAVCEFHITDAHKNAQGGVMGGAIFTLADFALAISCNIAEEPTVSVDNNIRFLKAPKGQTLRAVAQVDRSGRNLGYYTVNVTDELDTPVAIMTATCFRRA